MLTALPVLTAWSHQVVVDLEAHRRHLKLSKMSKAAISRFDTGAWQMIHRAPLVSAAENASSVNMECAGVQLSKPAAKNKSSRTRRQGRSSAPGQAKSIRSEPSQPSEPIARDRLTVNTSIETMQFRGAAGIEGAASEEVLSPAQRIKLSRRGRQSRGPSGPSSPASSDTSGLVLLQSQFNFAM